MSWFKAILVLGVVLAMSLFFYFDLQTYLTLERLQESRAQLEDSYTQHQVLFAVGFVAVYIVMAALSLPGALILTLAGGAIFGLILGTVLVSIGSTVGASCAFIASRYLFGESIQRRFGDKLEAFNQGVKKEGGFYLFTLRLIPAFPFFVINLVMGLTPIPLKTFFLVSQAGMLPGTIVYVNAGTQLSQIQGIKGILSPSLLLSFVAIGLLPIASKKVLQWFRRLQKAK